MNLLAECVNAMKREVIKTHQSNLFTLFLEALDFRVHHDQEASVYTFQTKWREMGIKSKTEALWHKEIIQVYMIDVIF